MKNSRTFWNIAFSILALVLSMAILRYTLQTAKESTYFSQYEKELIFSKKYDTSGYVEEGMQLLWENLVSDNISKSGYDVREDTLMLNIKTIFYTNSDNIPMPVEYIERSYKIQQNLLNRLGIKIKFVISPIKTITGKPEKVVSYVNSDYYAYDIDYFSLIQADVNALTVVIYNDPKTDNVGMSYGIPSNLIKLELKGLDPAYATIAHEIFHALGLFHTHKVDITNEKYSYKSGDMIGDTPISCPLYQIVKEDCELVKDHKRIRSIIEQREMYKTNKDNLDLLNENEIKILTTNIMSYTFKPCRQTLTNEQINKVLFTIQTNKDVREMFSNFKSGNYLKELSTKVKTLQ